MPGVVRVLPEGGYPSSLPLACPFDGERENSLGIFERVGRGSKFPTIVLAGKHLRWTSGSLGQHLSLLNGNRLTFLRKTVSWGVFPGIPMVDLT